MERLRMRRVRQHLAKPRIEDVPFEIAGRMARLSGSVRPGMSVAVTAGSRGITNIALILKAVVHVLRDLGAKPFIVSAMGSHGGGTTPGQERVLHHLGITEESVGAPFRMTSTAVEMGTTESGRTLFVDAEAAKADGIFVVNRIKPHTAFRESLASGLLKMLSVGLGKVPGATQVHKLGSSGLYSGVLEIGLLALRKLPVLGGLAIVENSLEETARLEVLLPEEMEEKERELLRYSWELLPRLPLGTLDLLMIEEIGKNYSGTGMDTNVIGRWKDMDVKGPITPEIKRIVVLRLCEASEGNANGIGMADFTTRKLVEAIDWKATLTNVHTTGFWSRAFCPPFPGSDREAIRWALDSLKQPPDVPLSAARIRNTLHLEELWLNEAASSAAKDCEKIGELQPLRFNEEGDLLPGE
ncbi:MAG: DUF2088 domain-containing protein [Desulfobacteraceae bacterium]|nr:MAG: DUF2088 domain-containing protein [Desulfobacteraceae bacterium]